MFSIGAGELLLLVAIAVLVLGPPVAVLAWLLMRRRRPAVASANPVSCRTCGRALAVGAASCALCTEPAR
jgi:hypothetical protein